MTDAMTNREPAVDGARLRPSHLVLERASEPARTERELAFPWRTLAALRDRPPRQDLVAGYVPEGSLVVIYGGPGSTKTFLAVATTCCVTTGASWYGHDVRPGAAAYIAAEGGEGIVARFDAWLKRHGRTIDPKDLLILDRPIHLVSATEAADLVEDLRYLHPDPTHPLQLVVIDTLALCVVPGDENSTRDMGLIVESIGRLRKETGAAVMLLHHSGWEGRRERGNSSLRGAADVMVQMDTDGDLITATCVKVKDGPLFNPLQFRLVPAGDSCVLELATTDDVDDDGQLTGTEQGILRALDETAMPGEGVSWTTWLEASGVSRATLSRARKRLFAMKLIAKLGKGYHVTDLGKDELRVS